MKLELQIIKIINESNFMKYFNLISIIFINFEEKRIINTFNGLCTRMFSIKNTEKLKSVGHSWKCVFLFYLSLKIINFGTFFEEKKRYQTKLFTSDQNYKKKKFFITFL